MKTVAENYAFSFHGSDRSEGGQSCDPLTGKVGEELRDFYSTLTESEPPGALLALAQMLDARLAEAERES